MQYIHPSSLTFLESHSKPLLFVGVMSDTSTHTHTQTSIRTSTLEQLLATFRPQFRLKWIPIPFNGEVMCVCMTAVLVDVMRALAYVVCVVYDLVMTRYMSSPVPDATVNVPHLISDFTTRRATPTSTSSSIDTSFIGQRQLLSHVKTFMDDERHGWRLDDGPTVYVFVGEWSTPHPVQLSGAELRYMAVNGMLTRWS